MVCQVQHVGDGRRIISAFLSYCSNDMKEAVAGLLGLSPFRAVLTLQRSGDEDVCLAEFEHVRQRQKWAQGNKEEEGELRDADASEKNAVSMHRCA